jgi:hypothetical protein
MPARLLKSSISLLTLLIELRYTLSRFIAHPLTSGFVAVFQALRDQWSVVQALEIALHEELSNAKAQVDIADAALDDFAARFSAAVLAVTGQQRNEFYLHFFNKPLNEFRRPVLSGQLKAMTDWILSLEKIPHPTLAAMRPELIALVEAGKTAASNRDTSALKIRDFRDVGGRKELFDKINAERKNAHGALSKLALATPGLPGNFQDQFFKPGEVDDEPEETIDSVDAEIKVLEQRLKERKERLDELKKAADDATKAADEKAQKAAKLAELNKDIEAKQREAQALKDELK